jgi:hypothetical protein
MKKWLLTIFLMIVIHALQAQYLHYWDDSRPRRQAPAPKKPTPPVEKPPVEIKMPEEMPPEITKPLKLNATTLISSVSLPFNTATVPPMIVREPMIFHDWPDKCPGLTGAVPVLNNYVPATIVLIITEKFKGHLYSISTTKGPDNQPQYKLKVCEDGMIQYEYADYKGNIIPKE